MSWKRLEQMREIRMWLIQIVAPTIFVGYAIYSIPEVKEKVSEFKTKIKTKFKKKDA